MSPGALVCWYVRRRPNAPLLPTAPECPVRISPKAQLVRDVAVALQFDGPPILRGLTQGASAAAAKATTVHQDRAPDRNALSSRPDTRAFHSRAVRGKRMTQKVNPVSSGDQTPVPKMADAELASSTYV